MTTPSPVQKKKGWYWLGITAWILAMLIIWNGVSVKVTTTPIADIAKDDTPKLALFQYKTIAIPDSANELLGYEFHAWKGQDYGVDYSCSAIIKKIDPAKDNYKIYSRAIVADIMDAIGSQDIEVNIYDDYQAYVLAELNGGSQFKILTKLEEDSIKNHTVATYLPRSDGWCDNTRMLTFYTQAGNKYTENELWQ